MAFPRALAMKQGEQNTLAQKHASGGIRYGNSYPHGALTWFAGYRHEAAHPLHNLVNTRPLAVGAVLTETGYARVDQARVDGFERIVIYAKAILHRAAEILHHHIYVLGQSMK